MVHFTDKFVALDYDDLKYNLCDDVIFPSAIRVDDRFDSPFGRFYT